jgi:hypothetical protein
MPELSLDDVDRHPLAGTLDRVRMPQLMLAPTSAQAPICRPLGYADASDSRLVWRNFAVGKVGITRRGVVASSS